MRPDPASPSLDDLNPRGNNQAVARATEEAVSFIASYTILWLLLRCVLRRRPETSAAIATFFAEGRRHLRPSMSSPLSSPNATDEEMKENMFFSLSEATRRRGGGDVTEAAYASFLDFFNYIYIACYTLKEKKEECKGVLTEKRGSGNGSGSVRRQQQRERECKEAAAAAAGAGAGATAATSRICEDVPEELDVDVPGFSERPINIFMPRLLQFFQSPHAILRKLSLGSINQFIVVMPAALFMSMDQYLQGLFHLAKDPSAEVRKLVCSAFVQLIEVRPSFLEPHLRNVIEYLLQANKDPDDEVSLEACEFWSAYCDGTLPPDSLREYLPRLIPVLMSNMAYADDDETLFDAEEDESFPDRDQDLKPRFHSSRFHGSDNMEDIIAFLIPLLDDKFPLIRSITCWTLSRFSKFIVQSIGHKDGYEQFDKVLTGLLRRILDTNKRVQEAACSAFATLEEEAADELAPRLEIILHHLLCAYGKYQRRNLRILYDAIGTLADAVGSELNQKEKKEECKGVLTEKRGSGSGSGSGDSDSGCEQRERQRQQAGSVAWFNPGARLKRPTPGLGRAPRRRSLKRAAWKFSEALGPHLASPERLDERPSAFLNHCVCYKIQVDHVTAGVQYDKEFIVCSLDLLSGLAEGLGGGIESLVAKSNLRDLLLQCCMDQIADIRQSAFALLGDLARVCPAHLHPRLADFLSVAAEQLNAAAVKEAVSVANNACWAIGELAVQLAPGRPLLAWNCTLQSGPVQDWCSSRNCSSCVSSNIMFGPYSPKRRGFEQVIAGKQCYHSWEACLGLSGTHGTTCGTLHTVMVYHFMHVRGNPSGVVSSLAYLCKAVASWHEIRNQDLHNEICQVLNGYKQMLGDGAWKQCMSTLDPQAVQRLSRFGV
ncbi:hypothetical protein C4D60_Mb08t33690 [Musa balbisiana]|uniref:Transportin-1 n=1 Tax=Musa balbisiana TaxID=52838 RepID=A0A4S8K8D5_MUSBA|nr:hypothetical protein C4D60_Mb08t33690 [Musa balbisiana]